jgi:hypothetical protein
VHLRLRLLLRTPLLPLVARRLHPEDDRSTAPRTFWKWNLSPEQRQRRRRRTRTEELPCGSAGCRELKYTQGAWAGVAALSGPREHEAVMGFQAE